MIDADFYGVFNVQKCFAADGGAQTPNMKGDIHMKPLFEMLQALSLNDRYGALTLTYGHMTDEDVTVISEEEITALEEKYGLLGKYLPAVLQARRELPNDPDRMLWAAIASRCFSGRTPGEATKLPIPLTDETVVGDIAPLFPLLANAEAAAKSYRDHGFTEEEIKGYMASLAGGLAVGERRTGRPSLSKGYYQWCSHYANASIFKLDGFNFNFREFPNYANIIRHNETGEIVILLMNKVFNAAGLPIESAGQNLPEGAFSTSFAETADAFYGHPVRDFRCVRELTAYPKTEWSLFIKSGDPVLGIHIPRGGDISEDATRKAFSNAQKLVRERYPERKIKGMTCNSWLLDPAFETILKEGSKIRRFGEIFVRFPNKSGGDAPYSFVFDKRMPVEEWPENTSLERGLKQYYLDGNCIFFTNGYYPLDEDV